MTPRRTIVGTIATGPLMRNRWPRRVVLATLVALFILLGFFPERYRAVVTLTPTDPASFGLGGALGQLGAINSVFGNQTAIEVALRVGRSIQVRRIVADRLKLIDRLSFDDSVKMDRWLKDKVDVRTLRGGIIQFDTTLKNPALARDIISAFAKATQERLAQISRQQTEYKRDVLLSLVSDSSDRLARARSAYDTFRLRTRYANPGGAITAIGERIPRLEERIKLKEVDLAAARQFATDDNMSVRQILAELESLKGQLAQAQATNPSQNNSVGRVIAASTQAEKLERELRISQALYDSYVRYLEGTSVEDLTSTASVRILEPPFVDSERQLNTVFLALAAAIALLWAAIEFYRIAPPIGERAHKRNLYA